LSDPFKTSVDTNKTLANALFKRRNLLTSALDLPVRLHRGRPPVSAETKRATNAVRQRRFQ
jgi:hypothetical protein